MDARKRLEMIRNQKKFRGRFGRNTRKPGNKPVQDLRQIIGVRTKGFKKTNTLGGRLGAKAANTRRDPRQRQVDVILISLN